MKTSDEGALRARLGAALDQLDTRPLVLDTVVRQGKAVMIRRLVLAAAAIAAAAALAVPTLTRSLSLPGPSAPTKYRVIVNHKDNGPNQRMIARGRVINRLNDIRWSVRAVGNGQGFHLHWQAGRWRHYVHGKLVSVGAGTWNDANLLPTIPANPVSIFDIAYTQPDLVAFAVRGDVSYLLVKLSNGQTVRLQPVVVLGRARPRLTAIAIPSQTSITQIRAYSASGELGYTVPYAALPQRPSRLTSDPGGDFQLVRWLQPGQPALPVAARYSIGRGATSGTNWSEQLDIGPWGTCVTAPTGQPGTCYPAIGPSLLGGKAAVVLAANYYSQLHAGWDAIVAEPAVSSIVARVPHGRSASARLYSHDGVKFATIVWSGHRPPTSWTAYSATGKVLGTGSF